MYYEVKDIMMLREILDNDRQLKAGYKLDKATGDHTEKQDTAHLTPLSSP
jgi:hypothetical protein